MRLTVLVLVMQLGLAAIAGGEEHSPAASAAHRRGWWFDGLAYAWIPGIVGSATVDDRHVMIDESVTDTLDSLFGGNAFAGSGMFELGHDRWSVLVDAFGGYADDGVRESVPTPIPGVGLDVVAKLKLKQVFVDFDVAYRLGEWTLPRRVRPLTVGVFAGARSYWIYSRVRASARITGLRQNVVRSLAGSDAVAWADPVIGVRWEVPLLDELVVDFRGDVGGFGAGSDLAWGIMSGLQYWLPWEPGGVRPRLAGGYKVVAFDYDFSRQGNVDLTFRGPYLGAGVAF